VKDTFLPKLHSVLKAQRWVGAMVLLVAASVSYALDTTSSIRGFVTDKSGAPIAGATVVVSNENTDRSRTITTNESGAFVLRNLTVGGGYNVTVTKSGYGSRSIEDLALVLGETSELLIDMSADNMEEVVVVGSAVATQVALGPSAAFGLRELETAPSINRNITDIVRIDPRVYVDESRGDINAVQCGGKNSRFNSFTLDGVRTNDSFGLNSNGYPTERIPFSYDAINQVAVELAPFDAKYGGFTACNINAVTKSGGNEWSGSAFYDYTDDDLRGDELEGDDIQAGAFEEKRYGVTVGGPIIQDKLFFFAAYEELEGANLFDRGPIGSGAVNEVAVTQAQLDEIADIARTVYQYDPGPIPSSLENYDEKFLAKIDWFINDNHRAAFTYVYNDGNNFTESDSDLNEFEFQNHLYERGAELDSLQGTLYSNWTDRFSTEIRLGHLELDNRQVSVGPEGFGEIIVDAGAVNVYLGGDDSRQSNKLDYEVDTYSFRGNYELDNHSLSFGIEREELDVFNLFIQHTQTQLEFRTILDFRNGVADDVDYNNSPAHNPTDAAADWGYEVTTAYIQDEFEPWDNVTVIAGLRYDRYTSDDKPDENPAFTASYGFSNSTNLDGEGLLQPRIGVTYDHSDKLTVRGGIGLYVGGDPNVWLSNNFSNTNTLQFGANEGAYRSLPAAQQALLLGTSSDGDDNQVLLFNETYRDVEAGQPNGPGWGVPSVVHDAVSTGTGRNFEVNYLDPDFEIPSEWKFSLGATYIFDNNMTMQADLIITDGKDTAVVQRADLDFTGIGADGYPDFASNRLPAFVLTNSSTGNESIGASIFFSQGYDNGLDWTFGYAYTDAEDVQPMTSSVAFSNYTNRAFVNPQDLSLSTSNYNIEHRFTGTLTWEKEWFGADNPTVISFYGHYYQGPSYSFANSNAGQYGFNPFVDDGPNVLPVGSSRNSEEGSWWGKVDFKVEQFYTVGPGRASAFLVIDNLTNLISDEWGVLEQADFPNVALIGGADPEPRRGDASLYQIRFGVKYDF
jgi:outer membrane receptor for ferrienterochelin and colicin